MTKEELERANKAYQRILWFEKKNRELSSIDTNARETLLVFGTPSKNIEVRIGQKALKHFIEYLLSYGEQEIEKCKKRILGTMTVKEYIEFLKTLDQDKGIWVANDFLCAMYEPKPDDIAGDDHVRYFGSKKSKRTMKKNKVQSPDEKNIKDFQNLVFNFLEERKIDYADGIAIIATILMTAFQHACTQLKISAEKTKKAFDAMLDEMKTQQDKCSDDLFEEGDNETTDAN